MNDMALVQVLAGLPLLLWGIVLVGLLVRVLRWAFGDKEKPRE